MHDVRPLPFVRWGDLYTSHRMTDKFHFFAFHVVGCCSLASQLGTSIHPVAGFCCQPGFAWESELFHVTLHCHLLVVDLVHDFAAMSIVLIACACYVAFGLACTRHLSHSYFVHCISALASCCLGDALLLDRTLWHTPNL